MLSPMQAGPLGQQNTAQNQTQSLGDTIHLSNGLRHESASNALFASPYQTLPPPVTEGAGTGSFLAQVSGGGHNSTQTILLVTLAVNAAMLLAFASVMLQELSLKASQQPEEIDPEEVGSKDATEWQKAQQSQVDAVRTAVDQKEAAKNVHPNVDGYNAQHEMLLSELLKRKTTNENDCDAAKWLKFRLQKQSNITHEDIRHKFADINHKDLDPAYGRYFTDDTIRGTIAKIFANPELSKAFQLAARGASNEDIDNDADVANKRACKTHVIEFKKFFDGVVAR